MAHIPGHAPGAPLTGLLGGPITPQRQAAIDAEEARLFGGGVTSQLINPAIPGGIGSGGGIGAPGARAQQLALEEQQNLAAGGVNLGTGRVQAPQAALVSSPISPALTVAPTGQIQFGAQPGLTQAVQAPAGGGVPQTVIDPVQQAQVRQQQQAAQAQAAAPAIGTNLPPIVAPQPNPAAPGASLAQVRQAIQQQRAQLDQELAGVATQGGLLGPAPAQVRPAAAFREGGATLRPGGVATRQAAAARQAAVRERVGGRPTRRQREDRIRRSRRVRG